MALLTIEPHSARHEQEWKQLLHALKNFRLYDLAFSALSSMLRVRGEARRRLADGFAAAAGAGCAARAVCWLAPARGRRCQCVAVCYCVER
jgi:ferric-dicitrate binding protein FerR (iron transport regulator)